MTSPERILADANVIAVVGASRDPSKPAHSIPAQLRRHGWRVIPVNPYAEEIWGEKVYRSLADIPERVDLVNVFRPAADAPRVAREAAAIGAKAIWLQQDIVSPEARAIAEQAGMAYVEDNCTAVVRALYQLDKRAA